MGEPALSMPPGNPDNIGQPNTDDQPTNIVTWDQVERYMDDKFEKLALRIGGQIDEKLNAYRGEVEGKMKESEDRSKKYTDSQADSIQQENKKHITSIEFLVSEVVSNVNKRLDAVVNGIENKLGQWNTLFTSAQHSISNIHQVSADLQAGQRDLEQSHRQQATQIDALQERGMKQVKIDAKLRRGLYTVTQNTNQNTTLITSLLQRFEPMAEWYRLEMEIRAQELERKREKAQSRKDRMALLRMLFGTVGTRQIITVVTTLLGLLFARIAAVTGIDLSPSMQSVLDFVENLMRGISP